MSKINYVIFAQCRRELRAKVSLKARIRLRREHYECPRCTIQHLKCTCFQCLNCSLFSKHKLLLNAAWTKHLLFRGNVTAPVLKPNKAYILNKNKTSNILLSKFYHIEWHHKMHRYHASPKLEFYDKLFQCINYKGMVHVSFELIIVT